MAVRLNAEWRPNFTFFRRELADQCRSWLIPMAYTLLSVAAGLVLPRLEHVISCFLYP